MAVSDEQVSKILEVLALLRLQAGQLGDFMYEPVRQASEDMISIIDSADAVCGGRVQENLFSLMSLRGRIAELEAQLTGETNALSLLRENGELRTRAERAEAAFATERARNRLPGPEWGPCSIPGYEQRINSDGRLETRPIDAERAVSSVTVREGCAGGPETKGGE